MAKTPRKTAPNPRRGTYKKKATNPRDGDVRKDADGNYVFVPGAVAAPAAGTFPAADIAERLRIYWKSGNGNSFVIGSKDGRWSIWPEQAVIDLMREQLPERLIAIKARDGERTSEVKRLFLYVRQERRLDEIFNALPGYKSCVHDLPQGERVLVKSAPRLVEPKKGDFPTITALIDGRLNLAAHYNDPRTAPRELIPEHRIDQTPWFYSWCKIADDALRNGLPGQWRQGHALIITGPAGCGKNRVQENFISPLLGSREADPTKLLFDGDEFNGDAFAAEHLLLSEVPTPSQKTVDRTLLSERIKRVVAQGLQRMRLMRTEPWTVYPFWRLTISVNDDPDKLRSLPVITPDLADKVLIFHCAHRPLPMPTKTIAEQAAFRNKLLEELPAFVWWLQNEWEIPADLLKYPDGSDATRFGFREFHHPLIRGGLYDETSQVELLAMIDQARFTTRDFGSDVKPRTLWEVNSWSHDSDIWWERSLTLQQLLTGDGAGYDSSVSRVAKKFFDHNSCGRLLARLAEDQRLGPRRVEKAMGGPNQNLNGWRISRP